MPKILVVDDSSFMRSLIIESLKKAKYTNFIEASNGNEAVKSLKKNNPDLVLLDIVMGGGMDGISTLKEIKAINPHAKVIMVTVVDQPKVTEEAKKLGASDFITKPVDPKKLINAVKQALKDIKK